MSIPSNRFTLKIIISYLVLGALAVFVSVFLYNELKEEFKPISTDATSNKIVETGTLINSLYETDSYANLALLSLKTKDFDTYLIKNDSLFAAIDSLKLGINQPYQLKQLDSVKMLLNEKESNIEQLRLLKITNGNDTSLDAILEEFKTLETNMGVVTIENFVEAPRALSSEKRAKLQSYIDYVNASRRSNSPTVKAEVIDSMLAATRYIVSGAKRSNQRLRKSLLEQEGELIENDLNISEQLRRIIFDFDAEIIRNKEIENVQKEAAMERSSKVLRFAAIAGTLVILLFSYWLITDFFRAERLKNTLQKEKQTTLALLKSREQLISTVSHDLKTPLSTITGYTELFKNTSLTDKQRFYTDHIGASTNYISKLADDLLDLSKLEAGKIRLDSVPFSMTQLVKRVAENVAGLHIEKPVKLILNFDQDLEDVLFESDPIRMEQIVTNLISNAFKFTHKGNVTVGLTASGLDNSTAQITLTVADTGIGIGKEKQDLIFTEFTQAESDTAQKFGGSGLGLTISKKLTKLLGGKLQLKSKLNHGSTFTFSVGLKRSKHKLQVEEKAYDVQPNLKAIILDDDPALLSMLAEGCRQRQMEVRTYSSFDAVLKEKDLAFDFLLTDMQMPTYSGYDVLEAIHSMQLAQFNKQPILLMTGDKSVSKSEALEKGFTNLLEKPFSIKDLMEILAQHFPGNPTNKGEETGSQDVLTTSHHNFDLSLLYSFLESNNAIKEVLAVFVLQSEINMSHLKNSVESKDFQAISNTAHKMLTMCRQIQAKNVIPLLEKLEATIEDSRQKDQLASTMEALTTAMTALIKEVKTV